MMVAKALACSRVAPRVGGDAGQEKGRTQKSEIGVRSLDGFSQEIGLWCGRRELNPGYQLGALSFVSGLITSTTDEDYISISLH